LALAKEMGWDGSYTGCPYLFWLPSKNTNLLNMDLFLNKPQIITLLISPIELAYLAEDERGTNTK
jgi:hypothetical protein